MNAPNLADPPESETETPAAERPQPISLPDIRGAVWGALDAMTLHLATFTEVGDHARVAEVLDVMRGLNIAMAGLHTLRPI